MKTNLTPLRSATSIALVSTALLLSACSKTNDSTATTTASTDTTAPGSMAAATSGMTASWESLRDYSYDRRSEFATSANAYAAEIDRRLQNAKGETSERLAEARDELRTAANDVSNATAETWESTKERVGRAWQKAESAVQAAE